MSTVLKLAGVKTYMSGLLFHINLNRGDVIRVSDEVAGKIGGLHRMSENDAIKIYFFETVAADTPLTYDFTSPTVLAEAANRAGDSDFMKRTAAKAADIQKAGEPTPVAAPAPAEAPAPAPVPAPQAVEAPKAEEQAAQEDPQEPEAAAAPAASVVPARKRATQRAAK